MNFSFITKHRKELPFRLINCSALITCAVVGLAACGSGSSTSDSSSTVSLPVTIPVGTTVTPPNNPQALTDINYVSKLDAQKAVAKLASLVRFYYPSDEALGADWDRLITYAMRRVENVKTRGELVRELAEVFHPVAPALAINGYWSKSLPTSTGRRVAWHYKGSYVAPNYASCLRELGLESGGPSTYTRSRESASISRPAYFPADETITEVIDGGLKIEMPIVLPANEQGTLPKGSALPPAVALESLAPNNVYANLGAAAIVWGALRNFHPYQADLHVDVDAALETGLIESGKASNWLELVRAIELFTAAYKDGHLWVSGQLPWNNNGWVPFETEWLENQIVVTWTAGARAGAVQRGDIITQIGTDLTANYVNEQSKRLSLGLDKRPIAIGYDWFTKMPTSSQFYIQHADNTQQTLTFNFGQYDANAKQIELARIPPVVQKIEDGVFLVTTKEGMVVAEMISQIRNAKAVILDTRKSSYTGVTSELAQYFAPLGIKSQRYQMPHYTKPWQKANLMEDYSYTRPPAFDISSAKVFVLMDRHTQSWGETWLNLLKGQPNIQLVGEPTRGANGDITCAQIWGGASAGGLTVTYTGLHVSNLDRSQHHAIGTLPDIAVSQTVAGVRAGRDEVMEKAVALAHAVPK